MAERKKTGQMRGGFDPSEMGKRSWEKRRKAWEAQQEKRALGAQQSQQVDLTSVDPLEVLRQLAKGATRDDVRMNAAKALAQMDDGGEDAEWRKSVQVREDFEPPTVKDLAVFAARIGVI